MLQTEICPAHDVSRGAYDVVIPCYNRERTVTQAVDSVLAQSPAPTRIILVDDGSTDGTADVLRALEERHPTVTAVLPPRVRGGGRRRPQPLRIAGARRRSHRAPSPPDKARRPDPAPASSHPVMTKRRPGRSRSGGIAIGPARRPRRSRRGQNGNSAS